MVELSSDRLHATAVAIGGVAVLIEGPSGSGKSDLALRLIDRGAVLISDDQTLLIRAGSRLLARPPQTIAGKLEVRGVANAAFARRLERADRLVRPARSRRLHGSLGLRIEVADACVPPEQDERGQQDRKNDIALVFHEAFKVPIIGGGRN